MLFLTRGPSLSMSMNGFSGGAWSCGLQGTVALSACYMRIARSQLSCNKGSLARCSVWTDAWDVQDMHRSRVWTHTVSLNLLYNSDLVFHKFCTVEGIHEGVQGQHGISQTWHWRKHCAAEGAAPQGCRLCSPSVGSDAAPQQQPLDYLHSPSLELSCLRDLTTL